MKVYRPRLHWMDDERLSVPSLTIYEAASGRDTGLLDADGNPLFAFDQKEPIGFVTNFSAPVTRSPRRRE